MTLYQGQKMPGSITENDPEEVYTEYRTKELLKE